MLRGGGGGGGGGGGEGGVWVVGSQCVILCIQH